MKKAIVWIMSLCLLLAVTGCRREAAPAGEAGSLPLSSAESQAAAADAPPVGEESQPTGSEGEADASTLPGESSQAESETSATPSELPPVTTEAEPPPAVSSTPETVPGEGEVSVPVPLISTVSLPTSYFDPPHFNKTYEHTEDTLEEMIAWINSPGALTEEGGVYKEAVEYYRDRGYLFCPALGGALPEYEWINFNAEGSMSYIFENSGSVWCAPLKEYEAEAASGGIVSYLEAQNITMTPNASAPLPGQEYPFHEELGCRCIDTWSPKQVQLANGTRDAVLEVLTLDPDEMNGLVSFYPYLHWLEGGFHLFYSYGTLDPVEAYTPDQEVLSQVQMINVPLTGSTS